VVGVALEPIFAFSGHPRRGLGTNSGVQNRLHSYTEIGGSCATPFLGWSWNFLGPPGDHFDPFGPSFGAPWQPFGGHGPCVAIPHIPQPPVWPHPPFHSPLRGQSGYHEAPKIDPIWSIFEVRGPNYWELMGPMGARRKPIWSKFRIDWWCLGAT
jgi:hypothetical protein